MARPSRKDGAAGATAVNPRALEFRQQLDGHTRTLVESFGTLLRSAKITNPQSITREEFQVNVATASLATAGEGLVRQIREVKLAVMLQDEAAMDREMDQALEKIAEERKDLEKELEALSNELKAAYARAAMARNEPTEPMEPMEGGSEASVNSFTLMDVMLETSGKVDAGGESTEPFGGVLDADLFDPMDLTSESAGEIEASGSVGMDFGAR